ncbi:MAG TPA: CDF family Co(II)/Ni(II) efflux transporter DmeF [Rhodocyclaceae bacterium]|nr:CDF family Co(II)/Ni(II) efflux transporter DmeF [Rhodocyclaceae bacterium]
MHPTPISSDTSSEPNGHGAQAAAVGGDTAAHRVRAERRVQWAHDHAFDTTSRAAERSTRAVMWLTAAAMVVEIAAGWWFNSMALLADGWHMSTHALAIGLSAFAYASARRYAKDPRFAFGTWKIEILGGFANAIFLLAIAVFMVLESTARLASPQPIQYREAIVVAVLGLLVNIVSALMLGKAHHHGHDHADSHSHDHGHHAGHAHRHDLNLRSAYLHVMADAATSVLAIVALAGGWLYGWAWLDPVMGIVGAVLVAVWARGLIMDTAKVLLDREMDHPVVDEIRQAVEAPGGAHPIHITDLHVWRVGKSVYSCAMTLVTDDATLTPAAVRERLSRQEQVVHSTIEIHQCTDPAAFRALGPQHSGAGESLSP